MKSNPARVKLTYDDFLLFPDDGQRHELIDGEHYVTPLPNMKHQAFSGNLFFLIRSWLEAHPVGRIFYAPFDVVFTNFDVVEPDLLYISHRRAAEILTEKHVTGAPEVVIEIGSPSTKQRDVTIKLRLYERCGVPEYWVVDPDARTVRVYLNRERRFDSPRELQAETNDQLTSSHFEGLQLPLRKIFE